MALREYTAQNGIRWNVWNVQPTRTFTPPRSGRERRVGETPGSRPERRSHHDRRHLVLTTGLEHGWLCFESASEKRRLAPVPADWETCSEVQLQVYATRASPVQQRLTERHPQPRGGSRLAEPAI